MGFLPGECTAGANDYRSAAERLECLLADRGRETLLVGRPVFKTGWGRQAVPGGFDSHSLPPRFSATQIGTQVSELLLHYGRQCAVEGYGIIAWLIRWSDAWRGAKRCKGHHEAGRVVRNADFAGKACDELLRRGLS